MSHLSTAFKSSRPNFLVLAIACVFLGMASASVVAPELNTVHMVLVVIGAVCAHVSVNAWNEYLDFHSGLDSKTIKTPFSGGSGALIDNPQGANTVKWLGIVSLAISSVIGAYFAYAVTLAIVPVGLFGVAIIISYTQWINRSPLLCLLAPGFAFGPLMVLGSHWVLAGQFDVVALFVSLVVFFPINNLLLLNQFPDVEADKSVGRNHLAIAKGRMVAAKTYCVMAILAVFSLAIGIVIGELPTMSAIGSVPLLGYLLTCPKVLKHNNDIEKLMPAMGINVAISVFTPFVLGASLLLA